MGARWTQTLLLECFWPAVTTADLEALDERARAATARLRSEGQDVWYRGSILVRQDEVVFCLFDGPRRGVERAAERAGVSYERIVDAVRSVELASDNDRGASATRAT